MGNLSKGRYAFFISDRSGLAYPYREMVKEWNGARVHTSEYEPKQPQLEPKPYTADPQGLPHPKTAILHLNHNCSHRRCHIGERQKLLQRPGISSQFIPICGSVLEGWS